MNSDQKVGLILSVFASYGTVGFFFFIYDITLYLTHCPVFFLDVQGFSIYCIFIYLFFTINCILFFRLDVPTAMPGSQLTV